MRETLYHIRKLKQRDRVCYIIVIILYESHSSVHNIFLLKAHFRDCQCDEQKYDIDIVFYHSPHR